MIVYRLKPERQAQVGRPCAYCSASMTARGERQVSRDHVMPRAAGYKFSSFGGRNKVYACKKCNNAKSGRSVFAWHDALVAGRDPRAPIVKAFIDRFLAEVHPWTEKHLRSGKRYWQAVGVMSAAGIAQE